MGHESKWVLLGTLDGKGIYRAAWNAGTGELGIPEVAAECNSPDYFAMHPKLPVLYTTNEGDGDAAGVSSYRVDPRTASLTLLKRVPSGGNSPCYISVDHTGRLAFAANYGGGSLGVFSLGADGALGERVALFHNDGFTGPGPVPDRQDASHFHCAVVSPDNGFVLACDLGDDAIFVFPIAPGSRTPLGKPVRIAARRGSGPRHLAFHPNGRWLYCMHELDCTVDLYEWSARDGQPSMTLREGSAISTLAPGKKPAGDTGCELVVSEYGRFLTTCTRTEDTLTVFGIDAHSGLLTRGQSLPCGGASPRIFAFDPTRKWLVVANQKSSQISVFGYDVKTGQIAGPPREYALPTPMFVQWI